MQHADLTLVTGSPGWLGTRLVEVLRKRGREVRCFVLNGMDAGCLKKLGAEVVYGDVKDKESIKRAVDGVKTVFHCAAVEHTLRTRECYKVSFEGTRNLLEGCVEADVEKFIFVSSSSAQGRNADRKTPMTEGGENRPYSAYGRSKLLAEDIVRKFNGSGKMKTVIIRPIWFYGPNLPEKTLFLVRMVKKGRPLMFGKGDAIKSMTYIDNVVDALVLAESNRESEGKTYWIADKRPYTVKEIYGGIADNLGVEIRPRALPVFISRVCEKIDIFLGMMGLHVGKIFSAGEISRDVFCSIEKAEKELGYKPRVEFKEGMRKTIEWCEKNSKI